VELIDAGSSSGQKPQLVYKQSLDEKINSQQIAFMYFKMVSSVFSQSPVLPREGTRMGMDPHIRHQMTLHSAPYWAKGEIICM
jgi:hypothetical protein